VETDHDPTSQRFIDDLRLRDLSPKTVMADVAGVVRFVRHFGRSPAERGAEEVRSFQLHLLLEQATWSLLNQTICALRCLYRVALGRFDVVRAIAYSKKRKTLPGSREDPHRPRYSVRNGKMIGWKSGIGISPRERILSISSDNLLPLTTS
jgi:hypothetical protein